MLSVENVAVMIEAWKVMAGRLPGSSMQFGDGVATIFGNVPMPFLNISIVERSAANGGEFRKALGVAVARAKAAPHPSLVALCEEWLPADWKEIAAEQGLAPMMNLTGMAVERLLPPRRALPNLKFVRVSNDAAARDLAMVNAQAYHMPAEMFECICNLHLWRSDSCGIVGYADGRAVTAAATFPVAATTYVALVATLPDEHGKGYAEAAMRKAIEESGPAKRVTLHATDIGRPLYEAMGFACGSRIVLFAPAGTA